jgi:hypothetical protein
MMTSTRLWAGSTPVLLTTWAGELQLSALEQGGASAGARLEWDGTDWVPSAMDVYVIPYGETLYSGASLNFHAWNFTEATPAQPAYFEVQVPEDYSGGALKADVWWTTAAGASGAGENIYFKIVGYARGDGESLNVSYPTGTWVTSGDISTNAYDIDVETVSSANFTVSGTVNPGDTIFCKMERDEDHANDDISALAYVTKVRIYE